MKGLDFFPLYVNFFDNEKIQYVSARFGMKGEICAIRLLVRLYRNGYLLKWDEDAAYLFSRAAGSEISPGLANNVVQELVKREFFDKGLFDRFGVLTSRHIQEVFLKACSRRKSVEMEERFILVDCRDFKNIKIQGSCLSAPLNEECMHDVCISNQNVDIKEENDNISTQSKVKKSKVKDIKKSKKESEGKSQREAIKEYAGNTADLEEALLAFCEMRKKLKKPMTDYALQLALKKLEVLSGGDKEKKVAIVQQSIENGWQGLYEYKGGVAGGTSNRNTYGYKNQNRSSESYPKRGISTQWEDEPDGL